MKTIVIPRRELQWIISRTGLEAGLSAVSGLDLSPAAWTQLKRVGAWLTDDTAPLAELARQGLVTLVPGDLPLTLRAGVSSAAPPSVPWHLQTIGLADETVRSAGGRGIRVGIIDTGVDDSEAEVHGKVEFWANCDDLDAHEAATGAASVDFDPQKHGTQVASLIVGRTLGVAPAATLAVAALDYPAKSLPAIALFHALTWLRGTDFHGRARADVINVSLHCDPCSTNLTDLFFQAAQDMIVTAAIGPHSWPDLCSYPASSRGVVGVGALTQGDQWAGSGWSFGDPFPSYNSSSINYLPKPELHAPGFNVRVAGGVGQGSSFASAIAAGCAAVLLSRDGSLMGAKKGDDARAALFASTRCLRLNPRIIPGAWVPVIGP